MKNHIVLPIVMLALCVPTIASSAEVAGPENVAETWTLHDCEVFPIVDGVFLEPVCTESDLTMTTSTTLEQPALGDPIGICSSLTCTQWADGSGTTYYLLGIMFWDAGYGGAYYRWWAANVPGCANGARFGAPTVPLSWNDRVSSAKSYNYCDSIYYQHEQYNRYSSGASVNCVPNCYNMHNSNMGDKASSIIWY